MLWRPYVGIQVGCLISSALRQPKLTQMSHIPADDKLLVEAMWVICNHSYGSQVRMNAFRELGAVTGAKRAAQHTGNSQLRTVAQCIFKAGVQTKREVLLLGD